MHSPPQRQLPSTLHPLPWPASAGSESLFVCLDSSCSAKMPWRQARDELDWEQCRSFNWECTLDGYSIGLSAAVGGLFLVYSGIFLLLM